MDDVGEVVDIREDEVEDEVEDGLGDGRKRKVGN